jgi:hypothetical protein
LTWEGNTVQAKETGIVGWIRRLGRGIGTRFLGRSPVKPDMTPEEERQLNARLLRLVAADLSEKYYASARVVGVEEFLWRMAVEGAREDGKLLMYLARRANGWWVWDDLARAEVLIPLDVWIRTHKTHEDTTLETIGEGE